MKKIITSFLIFFTLISCTNKYSTVVKNEQPENVVNKLNTYIILDVRTPEEFAEGHLPNAINIDVTNTNFEEEVNKLDKKLSYLVYCRSGKRSSAATSKMATLGFQKITNLEGGISNWKGDVVH